ncbi:MAG: DUF3316 domain-containing protein [Tannerellaceae bacterium]|jgi:hypothetical protein|nr:DUF3316 domain-containing protein [Tannerellaceae bacterium]
MKRIIGYLWVCFVTHPLLAQYHNEEIQRGMNEGTLIGIGTSQIRDTYLSPFNYAGWGARIFNERMTFFREMRFSRQQIISVDISSTENPAENVNDFGAFVNYSFAYHYRLQAGANFRLLTGASAHLMGGFIYNTRNGNNPLSAKVDVDLNFSFLALYRFRINGRPVVLRYQGDLPLVGVFFAPHYGISYYEIFNAGNMADVIKLNSFHNKFSLKTHVTMDIPVHNATLRLGYLSSLYHSDINDIKTHILSNTFMIGWVKQFMLR